MGPGVNKLFLEAAGQPVIAHTWQRFETAACIDHLILVIRDGLQEAMTALAKRCGFAKPFQLVTGGVERQDSVWNGLCALPSETDVVAIHDGARPCVTEGLIAATVAAAREAGAAVAAQPVTDTIKASTDGRTISQHLDRGSLWAVQTPQTFRVAVIRRALATARERGLMLTDDTAACELIGQPVRLVPGLAPNPKITTLPDLRYLEALLSQK